MENAKILLDAYLKENSKDLGGLLARGTARALSGELQVGVTNGNYLSGRDEHPYLARPSP